MSAKGEASTRSQASVDVAHALDGQQRAEDLLVEHGRVRRAGRRPRRAWRTSRRPGPRRRARRRGPCARPRRCSARRAPARRARSPAGRRSRAGRPGRRRAPRPRPPAARAARRGSPRGRARGRPPSTSGPRRGRRRSRAPGTTSSRSASESTITQFLPPISAITRLRWLLARRAPAAASRTISSPTAPEPVKAIVCTRGSLDQRGADVALAGQQRRPRRAARRPRAARGTTISAQPGDCSAGLSTTALPVARPGGDHPERDREREVPRRDHRDDAARGVAQRVALARDLQQRARPGRCRARRGRSTRGSRSPRRRRRRPPATASRTRAPPARRPPAAARAATARRARSISRALGGRRRGPPARAALRRPAAPRRRRRGVALAARRHDALRRRRGRSRRAPRPRARSSPIHTGTLSGGCASSSRERLVEPRAHGRAAQLEDRLVGERLHGGRAPAAPAAPRSGRRAACSARNESLVVFSSSRRTR